MAARPLAQILEGADALVERRERVAFVATLYESGELEHYGDALRLGLTTSWNVSRGALWRYVREVEAMAALSVRPEARARLVAGIVGRYKKAERTAYKDKKKRPAQAARAAVAAITGQAKVLGLVPSAVPAPAPQSGPSGKAGVGPGLRLVDRHGRDLSPPQQRADDTEGEG